MTEYHPQAEPKGVKIIYAAYSKCCTKSIAAAFRILNYKVYDFAEHQLYNHETWLKFLDTKLSRSEKIKLLYEMHKDVDVLVAMPAYTFWRELTEAFPEAKVIFYARSEEAWKKSAYNQLNKLAELKKVPDIISLTMLRIFAPTSYKCQIWFNRFCDLNISQEFKGWYTFSHGRFVQDKLIGVLCYRRHNADVLMNCPKDKLLVLTEDTFNWETICSYINKPIPKDKNGNIIDFPHVNKAGAFAKEQFKNSEAPLVKLYKKEVRESCVKYFSMGVAGYFVYKYKGEILKVVENVLNKR